MKALTLWQPWATLIALGAKRFETRDWATSYVGPLLIHAASGKYSRQERDAIARSPAWGVLRELGDYRMLDELPHGEIVALVDLREVLPVERVLILPELTGRDRACGDFSPGRFAWRLHRVDDGLLDKAPRIRCVGSRKLWTVPDQVDLEVRRRLGLPTTQVERSRELEARRFG